MTVQPAPSKAQLAIPRPELPNTDMCERILAAVDARHQKTIALLANMVRCPSVLGTEQSAQDLMAETFAALGLSIDRFPIDLQAIGDLPGFSPPALCDDTTGIDGRDNVVGTHTPRQHTGRSLILNGHIDVVPTGPVEMWSSPPFEPVIHDNRLFGRGAGDMKAGLAACVGAVAALRDMGFQPAAPLLLQSVIEEECTGNGALACLHRGYRADAAIIPEPFNHTLMIAQMGVLWVRLAVTGSPAHVLDTSAGCNAIDGAMRLASHLRTLVESWNDAACPHRHSAFATHTHPAQFNLGRIEGGEWTSSVPTRCTVDIRVGFYPDQTAASVRDAITQTVVNACAEDPNLNGVSAEVIFHGFQAEGYALDRNEPVLQLLAASHQSVCNSPAVEAAITCTTDGRFYALYGNTPATCYGPEATRIHGVDESVSLESLRTVTSVLALFIAGWCGLEPV